MSTSAREQQGERGNQYEAHVIILGLHGGDGHENGSPLGIEFGQYVPVEAVNSIPNLYKSIVLDRDNPDDQVSFKKDGRMYVLVELDETSHVDAALRQELCAHKELYLGRVLKVTGTRRLPTGLIENAHVQALFAAEDKSPYDCIWDGSC